MAKPLDLGLEERLLKARIQYVAQLKVALLDRNSLLYNTLEVYTSIIDGVLLTFWEPWMFCRGGAP